jgi:hypothetical protein
MSPITDDDLVLYRYRDGLDPARIEQITAALAASSELRERYAAIERALVHFGQEEIAADPDLSAQLWRRLEPKLQEAGVFASPSSPAAKKEQSSRDISAFSDSAMPAQSRSPGRDEASARGGASAGGGASVSGRTALNRPRAGLAPPLRFAFAAAAALVVALGVGFLVGRQSVTVSPMTASTEADASAARVLDAYVAANLRATEGVLLTASNSNDASLLEGNRELAQSLVESNRLYALAAARAGNARLADFLRQLEPVLLSLANQPAIATVQSSEDLRRFLDATDLLFQVRATEARLDRDDKRRT